MLSEAQRSVQHVSDGAGLSAEIDWLQNLAGFILGEVEECKKADCTPFENLFCGCLQFFFFSLHGVSLKNTEKR